MAAKVKEWTTALPDWEKKIIAGESLIPCEPLYPDAAEHAVRIFSELVLVDVLGSPRMGEVTRAWVMDFVASIFGAHNGFDGERLINEFFLLISKKNTKSTIAAGIMLTALIMNQRLSMPLIIISPTKQVADNSFIPARDMINADPELKALLNVSEHTRTITHRGTKATLQVIAAETETAAGSKAGYILIDELHIFGKRANAESMIREVRGGLASKPEGFTIYLTTQSDEPPAGVFAQKLKYARGVRDGLIVDKSFLPVLYEFPQSVLDANGHHEPENFYITNPNLGASVSERFLLSEYQSATENGQDSLRDFMAKHLNVEIGLALRSNRWTGAEFWEVNKVDHVVNLDFMIRNCEIITFGVDGGGLDDLLGFTAVGRSAHEINHATGEHMWYVWTHAWAHESAFERRSENAPRYNDFIQDGDLTKVLNVGEEVKQLAEYVKRVDDAGKLGGVGLDRAQIDSIVDALLNAGIREKMLIEVPQGWQLSSYATTTERKLAAGGMKHSGQRIMAWCIGNAKAQVQGNNVVIRKQEAGRGKIDPLIALFNAVALMSKNPVPENNIDAFLNGMIIA